MSKIEVVQFANGVDPDDAAHNEHQKREKKVGLPRSGKNIWKMKFFPGQGKDGEFSVWPGKFRKDF